MGKPRQSKAVSATIAQFPTKKIDLPLALRLRIKDGLTYEQIAERFDCTGQAVRVALGRFLYLCDSPTELQSYRENKAAVFETVEHALMERLLKEVEQGRASVGHIARAIDTVSKHLRLIQGQSTANIGLLVQTLGEVHKDLGAAISQATQVVVVGESEPTIESSQSTVEQ